MNLHHQILSQLKRLLHRPFAPAVLLAVLSGCGGDVMPGGDDVGIPENNVYRAGFNIVVSEAGNTSATRSSRTPEGDYDPGKGYENYIDIENRDFRFMFFGEDNKYISSLNVESVLPMTSGPTSKTYYVLGEITGDIDKIYDKYVKILAVANWGDDIYDSFDFEPGVTTIDDVCERAVYEYSPGFVPDAGNLIPLYGITNAVKLKFDALNLAKAGTIHMLRAYAKVDVELSAADEGKNTLESVKLVNYSSRGYCAPSGIYVQNDYVHNEYFADYANNPHIPDGAAVYDELPFVSVAEQRFRIYVPEFRNIGVADDSKKSYIMVRLKGMAGSYTDVRVDFKFYDRTSMPSGAQLFDPFDILRNYWYKFTLTTSPIKVTVQMVPYSEVKLTPDFGLILNPNWVPVYDDDLNISYWYDRETGQYFNQNRQPIDNPFWATDPVTGWAIIRDDDGHFMYYYDGKDGKYYDSAKNEIANPNMPLTNDKGWTIIRDKDGNVLYYYDKKNEQYYNSEEEPIDNPYIVDNK